MGRSASQIREEVWLERSVLWCALALLAAALLLFMAPASAVLARSSNPLAIHCLLTAVAFAGVWYLRQPGARFSEAWLPVYIARLASIGFGSVSFVLSAAALLGLQPQNYVLLPLVVPGLVGFFSVPALLELEKEKRKPETDEAADEVALAEEVELPVALRLRIEGFSAFFGIVNIVVMLFGFAAGTVWYYVVWWSVNDGTAFTGSQIVHMLQRGATANITYIVVVTAALAIVMAIAVAFSVLKWPLKRLWIRWRGNGLTEAQEALVETRLRAVWDYANRPDRKPANFAVWGLSSILFGAAVGLTILVAYYQRDIAFWYVLQHRALPYGWYVFDDSTSGLLFSGLGLSMAAWSLWHFLVDRIDGAPEAIATLGLSRKAGDTYESVKSLRRRLRRLVRREGDAPFEPWTFLLASRRRSGRVLYIVTALAVAGGGYGYWGSLYSYTLLTPAGIEDADAMRGNVVVHAWEDVKAVNISCTLNSKGESEFGWQVVLADGRDMNLFHQAALGRNLPELVTVDAILRGQGAVFRTVDPSTGKPAVIGSCLAKVGANLPDKPGFMRLMHQD